MKVYLVMGCQEWEYPRVLRVFRTEKSADKFLSSGVKNYDYDSYSIEEYNVED